jgi:hypothetical protein
MFDDDLRQEYDLSQLKGGVRGKYYRQAAESVNRALPLLADTARVATGPKPTRRR